MRGRFPEQQAPLHNGDFFMAIESVNDRALLKLLVTVHNASVDESAIAQNTVHYDISSRRVGPSDNPSSTPWEVEAANASNLATALTLAADVKLILGYHFRDALAHAEETIPTWTAPDPTDEATLVTWCAELKVKYNGHLENTDAHQKTDITNAIAATTPANLAECITLLNEAKTDLNAHILDAPLTPKIKDLA